jgi:2-polyprenyl-3-methyl-5-hydroxy-6-metoxy-1,4-benzoquinol methylase
VPRIPQSTSAAFERFSTRLMDSSTIAALAVASGTSVSFVDERLTTAIGEASQTLRLLAGVEVAASDRILEVGAGLGVASAFLSVSGFDVTALDPGGIGFEDTVTLSEAIALQLGSTHRWLRITAEELDPANHGFFSLIYSNNVLEHIAAPIGAFVHLANVLSDSGVSVHSCPNYSVPYEPHFGVPLVPGAPKLTAYVLPRSLRNSGVWKSLNFIRAKDVARWAESSKLDVHFRPSALAASLDRLGADPAFRSRHRLIAYGASAAQRVGLITLLRKLPARWATPMDFVLCRRDSQASARVSLWQMPDTVIGSA